jgi:hypothetical protein
MADRDEHGRLLPGHSIKGGRRNETIKKQIEEALLGVWTPEEIVQNIREAFEVARSRGSAKGMLAATFGPVEQAIGRATIKIERVEGDPISAVLDELRKIHQTTYTVIEAEPEAGISSENLNSHK